MALVRAFRALPSEIGMHVGDDGAAWLEAIDPGQRIVAAEMAGMRGIAQPVDDPEIEVLQVGPALAGMSLTSGV
jgi:hypothetical protein